MNDEVDYERSADMRLVELSRQSMGAAPAAASPWRHTAVSRVDLLAKDDVPAQPVGALLKVHFVARPAVGLIPGARVTFAISIENEGGEPAPDLVARIGYGQGCSPLFDDAKLDDEELDHAAIEALFGGGLALGELASRVRRTVIATARIDAGLDAIVVEADIRAVGVPILTAPPIALGRGKLGSTAVPSARVESTPAHVTTPAPEPSAETPFYELEPEESIVFEAADAALSTAAPVVPPPALAAPIASPPIAVPAAVVLVPALPEPPADPPLVLVRRIDRARLDAVSGMFASAGVGMLPHFLLANLIAAGQSPDESDPFGLGRFIDEQTTVLNRLWVAKRLRKPMDVSESIVRVEPLAPLSRVRTGAEGVLVARLAEPEREFVNTAIARGSVPFLRARQIALILQATAIVENGDVVLVPALIEYAKRAQNLMTKYALRAATKTPDEALATVDPVLDGYAKDVLTYLDTIAR